MNNTRKPKLIGSLYFIMLALVNLACTLLYGKLSWLDVVLLAVTCLPLLINKKMFYFFYGLLNCLVWLIIGILVFSNHMEAIRLQMHMPAKFIFAGYGLTVVGLFASLLLVYAGINSDEKNRFSFL